MSSSAWSRPTAGRRPQALLEGLEVVPRRVVDYKGRPSRGDGPRCAARAAARRSRSSTSSPTPTRPGSRHPKRYQDVEELLDAGIDVYTTLNIQHVESLNDVVAQITRIRVRETVPDSILDRADDIEVVDLSPDDLIQRLREGKVYVPRQAERALNHYFSRRQPHGVARAGAAPHRAAGRRAAAQPHAGPRHPRPLGGRRARAGLRQRGSARRGACPLCQAARRSPEGALDGPGVGGPAQLSLTEEQRDRIADTLRLADRLGGDTETLPGSGGWRTTSSAMRATTTSPTSSPASRALPLVRAAARLRRARSRPPLRQHQRACDRGRGRDSGSPGEKRPATDPRRAGLKTLALRLTLPAWRSRSASLC